MAMAHAKTGSARRRPRSITVPGRGLVFVGDVLEGAAKMAIHTEDVVSLQLGRRE